MVRHTGGQDHRNEAGRVSGSSGVGPSGLRRSEDLSRGVRRRNENRPPTGPSQYAKPLLPLVAKSAVGERDLRENAT